MYVYNPSNFTVANSVRVNDGSHSWSGTDIYTWFADRYTKAEVNSKVDTLNNGKVAKSGDNMSGHLHMNGKYIDGVDALQACDNNILYLTTNQYVHTVNHTRSNRMDVVLNNLHYSGSLVKDSYRGVKENINAADEERIKRILDVPVDVFDYRPGFDNGKKDVVGFIVDEVQDIIPEAVVIPEGWDESKFNALKGEMGNEIVPGINNERFIPYLTGMLQILNKKNEELEKRIAVLEERIGI